MTTPKRVTVELPEPHGKYNDKFGQHVEIGAGWGLTDEVFVWVASTQPYRPEGARELAASLLAAADAAEAK